jgi:hypothetical protein
MNKTVILTHQGSEIPTRVTNPDQARVRHGGKADHMVRMLALGDPLADAVIIENGRTPQGRPSHPQRRSCQRSEEPHRAPAGHHKRPSHGINGWPRGAIQASSCRLVSGKL